jgi:hypothetical protein
MSCFHASLSMPFGGLRPWAAIFLSMAAIIFGIDSISSSHSASIFTWFWARATRPSATARLMSAFASAAPVTTSP